MTQQVSLSKFIHRWRPTLQRMHLISPKKYPSALCNICKTTTETQNHIYCCNHPASREVQITSLRTVEKKAIEQGVNLFLIRSMLKGLHAWMHASPLPYISPKRTATHQTVREAYYAQDDLGWENLLRGRLHRSWEKAQTDFQTSRDQASSPKMPTIIKLLWDAAATMWKARNDMEHGTTKDARTQYATERMDAQLTDVYKKKHSVSLAARIQLFRIPLGRRKQYNLKSNERWLDMVRAAVANKRRHDEKNKKCQRTITTFLPVRDRRSSESSSTAKPYVPRKYVQCSLDHFHVSPVQRIERDRTQPKPQNVNHRKVKHARITAFFKVKAV